MKKKIIGNIKGRKTRWKTIQKNIFRSQCYNDKYRLHQQNGSKRQEKNHYKVRLSEVQETHKIKKNK